MKEPIRAVLDYIDENIDEYLSVGQLSSRANYSAPQIFRLFAQKMNTTPVQYALRRRLYAAAAELCRSGSSITEIAYAFGFASHDAFGRAFKRVYGRTPSAFRKEAMRLNGFYRGLHCIVGYSAPASLYQTEEDGKGMANHENKQEMYENFIKTYGFDVETVTVPAVKLAGILRPVGEDVYGAFCGLYDKLFRNLENRVYPRSENATHGFPQPSEDGQTLLYFVGLEVTDFGEMPDGVVCLEVPEQFCAVVGFPGGIDYDTIHYYFQKWTESQQRCRPDVHKIHPRLPEDCAWITYAPIWEYYTPNKDREVYEERIYMPIVNLQ